MRLRLPRMRVQSYLLLLVTVTLPLRIPWGYYYCVFRFGSGVCVCAPKIQVLQCVLLFPYPKRGLGIVDQLFYNV